MIGFHTPYNFSETSQLAISLAEQGLQFGLESSILSYQSHELGVHAFWDRTALSGQRQPCGPWITRCSHIVWFDVIASRLQQAKKLGRKNILLLQWQRLQPSELPLLAEFDLVVCPSRQVFDFISQKTSSANLAWAPWDPVVVQQKRTTSAPLPLQLLTVMNSASANEYGLELCHVLSQLLERNSQLELTLLYNKSWNLKALMGMSQLQRAGGKRVRILRKPSCEERLLAYCRHDWVLWPSICESTGHYGLESLYSGTPVIAVDGPITNQIVLPGINGILIPAQLELGELGAPRCLPKSSELLEWLQSTLADHNLLLKLQNAPWLDLSHRRRAHQEFWSKAWDLS